MCERNTKMFDSRLIIHQIIYLGKSEFCVDLFLFLIRSMQNLLCYKLINCKTIKVVVKNQLICRSIVFFKPFQ